MFKLNIECSKDITELKINFADGTVSTISNDDKTLNTASEKPESKIPYNLKKSTTHKTVQKTVQSSWANWDANDNKQVSKEIVKLPTVPDVDTENRPVNVADELQNLDI